MDAKIMVVDDNQDILESVTAVFEGEKPPPKVTGVTSGKEALAAMKRDRPDIVILDIMMPGLSGWDVASQMKDDPVLSSVPIVYLSAKSDTLSRQMGGLSAEDYIVKPFNPADLVRRVKDVLMKDRFVKGRENLIRLRMK
jgi:DNA-binding response OmpR family regulator